MDALDSTTTVKHGDKFSTTGINAVNPISRASTGEARCFTVTADVTVASNEADVAISPSIITSGAYQTVASAPADDGELVAITTDFEANLVFHPNAIALAMIPIELPSSCNFKARSSYDGFSIAVTKAFDIDGFKGSYKA